MKKTLEVGISLPIETVTQRIGIIGQTGMGKTHLTTVLAEEMLEVGTPLVCLDPQGGMHGLRSSRDGKSPGYSIIVLGGDHADAPLEPTAGAVIADWVCKDRQSCVLDLSNFKKGEQRRFATDFAEQLYMKNKEPLHLIVDEADMFAPQRPFSDQKRMLGAFEDLVRRGRKKGIGVTLATQRPAVVHKDVLTQVALLVSLRLTGPQDRRALEDWISYNASEDEKRTVLSSMATLPIGTAWFWSPGWLGLLKKAKVRQRRTFDSSATPVVGAKTSTPKRAKVDLKTLSARISDTIERVKNNDPAALRRKITELERELEKAQKSPQVDETTLFKLAQYEKFFNEFQAFTANMKSELAITAQGPRNSPSKQPFPTHKYPPPLARRTPTSSPSSSVGGGLQRILIALAQNPKGLTKKQIGIRAQLSSKSGTFSTYLSRGRTEGLIESTVGTSNHFAITEAGLASLGSYEPLPTGLALQDYWISSLSGGASRMLQALCNAYPNNMTDEELGQAAEVSHKSGTFSTYLSKIRTLELSTGSRDSLRASPDLFD